MEEKFFEIEIAGLKRRLPLCPVNDEIEIAAFVIFSDVEITVAAAKELLKIVPEFDVILCPEAKGIPLAYEMSRQSGKIYFIARKSNKVYMREPVIAEVKSITTLTVQNLYIDIREFEAMRGKRVLIVDDVISTGETLSALEKLLNGRGADVVGKAAVLAEGDAAGRKDITTLGYLPLFKKK